jgi:hypothetical protein
MGEVITMINGKAKAVNNKILLLENIIKIVVVITANHNNLDAFPLLANKQKNKYGWRNIRLQ